MSLDGPVLDASYCRPKLFVSPIIPAQEPSITKKLTNELQERIFLLEPTNAQLHITTVSLYII
jgi:hypothetical protein